MARRGYSRRRIRIQQEAKLDITTFLNLMVVLIPFLLVSAVFSRVAIMELSVPTAAGGKQTAKPDFAIEVIVRQAGFEIANGFSVEAAIPKKEGEYDMEMLTKMLLRLKAEYPEKKDATILMEPNIEYDNLIKFMDTVRTAEVSVEESGLYPEQVAQNDQELEKNVQKVILFPEISIGDAP